MAKFGIHSFPTLIFTDSSQKILNQTHGMGADEFEDMIKQYSK